MDYFRIFDPNLRVDFSFKNISQLYIGINVFALPNGKCCERVLGWKKVHHILQDNVSMTN